jgi:hypothetical protein
MWVAFAEKECGKSSVEVFASSIEVKAIPQIGTTIVLRLKHARDSMAKECGDVFLHYFRVTDVIQDINTVTSDESFIIIVAPSMGV